MAFKALGLLPGHVMGSSDYDELGGLTGIDFSNARFDDDFGLHTGSSDGERLARIEQICRVTGVPIEEAAANHGVDPFLARYYRSSLNAFKDDRYCLDFTDMIEKFADSGAYNALIAVELIIVDEAQDLSPIHWRALKPLFGLAKEVFIGGDDDQSIFKWAGADIKRFLSLPGERRVLPISHRLPRSIFRLAEQVSARVKQRIPKQWSPRDAEGKIRVAEGIDRLPLLLDDWILLARHNYQLSQYIEVLRRRGFVYEIYGKSSVDTPNAARIVAWESLRRGNPARGEVVKDIIQNLHTRLYGKRLAAWAQKLDDRATVNPDDFRALINEMPTWFESLIMNLEESNYYRECIRRSGKLDHKKVPSIKVSTIHGVKGGEAKNVVLSLDLSRAAFDEWENPETSDNELRVLYVGVTRASEALYLLHPRTGRYYGGLYGT
jgi:DNA helicase-2/ATP-dependent DNA helicase PcrA